MEMLYVKEVCQSILLCWGGSRGDFLYLIKYEVVGSQAEAQKPASQLPCYR